MYIRLHVQYTLFLTDFSETRITRNILKNTQISIFLKIRPVGVELFHADGQRDIAKLIVAFYNFVNAPKNALNYECHSTPVFITAQLDL
jgi:hypothetical protein